MTSLLRRKRRITRPGRRTPITMAVSLLLAGLLAGAAQAQVVPAFLPPQPPGAPVAGPPVTVPAYPVGYSQEAVQGGQVQPADKDFGGHSQKPYAVQQVG